MHVLGPYVVGLSRVGKRSRSDLLSVGFNALMTIEHNPCQVSLLSSIDLAGFHIFEPRTLLYLAC